MIGCYKLRVAGCKEEPQSLQKITGVMEFPSPTLGTARILNKASDQRGSDSVRPVEGG